MDVLFKYAAGILVYGLPIIIAITFHEAAHGFIAFKLGDDTAKRLGRVTFNPLKHIDPFGTILLPLILYLTSPFLFGYAKPVPVNFQRLNNPRRDTIFVAAAGPGTNILLALASAYLLKIITGFEGLSLENLEALGGFLQLILKSLFFSIQINVVLAVFNMMPLLPLDGGRVLGSLLPPALGRSFQKLERWGFFILIGLLFIVPIVASQLGFNFNPVFAVIEPIIRNITKFLLHIAGL